MLRYINMFRAKGASDDRWYYGDLIRGTHISHPMGATTIKPETVGMYTSFIDINGTRIFEGDIIKAKKVFPETIDYGIASFAGPAFWIEPIDRHISFHIWFNTRTNHEVIGNIHDNPEMLSLIFKDCEGEHDQIRT